MSKKEAKEERQRKALEKKWKSTCIGGRRNKNIKQVASGGIKRGTTWKWEKQKKWKEEARALEDTKAALAAQRRKKIATNPKDIIWSFSYFTLPCPNCFFDLLLLFIVFHLFPQFDSSLAGGAGFISFLLVLHMPLLFRCFRVFSILFHVFAPFDSSQGSKSMKNYRQRRKK